MYQDASGGALYLLIERSPPSKDQANLEAAATCGADEAGCQQQNFSLVELDDGRHALQVTGDVARVVNWLQGGIEFILAGPLASFDKTTALAMASEI
jgi:hypothetical protein